MKFSKSDIENFEQRYRGAFINSLTGFKSVNLLGSISAEGKTNLAIFSQVVHLGASPALIGIVFRPHTVVRDSLENLMSIGYFTLNHIKPNFFQQAHQTSARYQESEFEAVGLTPLFSENFPAPFVAEADVRIGLKYEQAIKIELNGTELVIASIQEVSVPDEIIQPDGFLDLEKAQTITSSGLDSYHTTQKLSRLSYAKPDKKPEIL